MFISVQSEPFDPGQICNEFSQGHQQVGAVVTFTGIVRNDDTGTLTAMDIEHYPGMTEKAIAKFVQSAIERFSLQDAAVVHRYGRLEPGDMIMMVATAASHRRDAFEAAEYLMDYLKSRAPFWKKEMTQQDGKWVDALDQDEDALSRWD